MDSKTIISPGDTQEVKHGKLSAADAAIPTKKILYGSSAGELISDLFSQRRS